MSTYDLARILMMEAMMSIATSFSSSKQALRRGAFALAVAGLAAIAPVATPAFAQQVIPIANTVDANTDCSKWKPGELMADTECEVLKNKLLRDQINSQQGRLSQEQRLAGCINFLKDAKNRGVVFPVRITRENACSIAVQNGMQPS
jgi:hypothetical protein